MTTILSTQLGGALQRRPDGWYWRDGTPEPRVRDMLLNDIAPNFRVMNGAVEIPHDWRAARHWPQGRTDTDAAEAIARLLSDVGKPASIYADGLAEALDEPASRVQGHTVPVSHWDAAMREPCGAWWDMEHQDDILATADRLRADMAATIRDAGAELYGEHWPAAMAQDMGLGKHVVQDWARGKITPRPQNTAALADLLDARIATLTALRDRLRGGA